MTIPIGKLLTEAGGRDAVHVAIAPTTAPCELQPGQHVNQDGYPENPEVRTVGIVDPFLREPVRKGERFWLFLYPNSVTSLRHEWTHPAYPNISPVEVDQAIKDYLDQKKTMVNA